MFGPEEEWFGGQGAFVPTTDVTETPAAIQVTMELPGLKPEDVKVEMLDGRLMVHGEKKEDARRKKRRSIGSSAAMACSGANCRCLRRPMATR
jgi:HSP20 family molecular chaperone IbpA